MAEATEDVYCTLLMSDSYLPGLPARQAQVDTEEGADNHSLQSLFDYVIPVEKIANPYLENLARLDRLDLRFAFTKISLWQQHQFRKIVYIDCDVVALHAPDELFDLPATFAAAPDIGWPDCFNSGVMLLTPNVGDYWSLQTLAASGTSFDGADQGLLNQYFGNRPWHRLSFTYNCTPSSGYQYEPAFRHFRSSIKMAHFIGKHKPWSMGRQELSSSTSAVYRELLGYWWSVYDRHFRVHQTSALGALSSSEQHTQRFVKDEELQRRDQQATLTPQTAPEASITTTEMPMSAPDDQLEAMEHAESHRQEVPFVAPENPWDATRSAPPTESKPEAKAFPSEHYDMSSDTHLFKPPATYPEPPKNMYYQVPPRPKTPEKPKPIFPWEHSPQKPARVFAETMPDPLEASGVAERSTTLDEVPGSQAASEDKDNSDQTPINTSIRSPSAFGTFDSFNRGNAWDNNTSIEAYVRAVRDVQNRRSNTQPPAQESNPTQRTSSPNAATKRKGPGSLVLTDFPTEVERPSLPVTPAPIRRPTFWGEEREEQTQLPSAAGVPEQQDWNPLERLEQLRKSSLIAATELPRAEEDVQDLPQRDFIESSVSEAESNPSRMSESAPQPTDTTTREEERLR